VGGLSLFFVSVIDVTIAPRSVNKFNIRNDVTARRTRMMTKHVAETSLGGTMVSLPTRHPLILSPTPPGSWYGVGVEGSGDHDH
jgi:hypothetical protein